MSEYTPQHHLHDPESSVDLGAALVEWLMGLEPGWVSGLGLPRTAALRVLGNGVVPQQAALAPRLLLCPHRWAVTDDR